MITNFIQNNPSQLLFNRSYSFTLGKKGAIDAIEFQNFWSKNSKGENVGPSPLRIVFEIEKNFVGTPNTTKFSIYNLSLETRSQIKHGDILELKAGYNGLMDRLFFGIVAPMSVKSVRNGADIVTTFEAMDGGSAILMTRISKSYPSRTKLYQIIEDIFKIMSLESDYNVLPIESATTLGLPDISFPRGKTVHGSCKDVLTDLLKPYGLDWSIQNNALVILPKDKGDNNIQDAIEIGPESGLIGIPSRNGLYFDFKALMNPKIRPGTIIKLVTKESTYNLNKDRNESLAGFYIVKVAKYHGDTFGSDWTVDCSCLAFNAKEVNSTINVSSGLTDLSSTTSSTA